MIDLDIGSNETKVHLTITHIGDDLDITITGGKEHIGCVGIVSSNSYNIVKMASHCEDEIVLPLVKYLSSTTDKNIVIKAGIHLDNISKNQIKEILENNKEILNIIMDYV
jgi:hypothetical protein